MLRVACTEALVRAVVKFLVAGGAGCGWGDQARMRGQGSAGVLGAGHVAAATGEGGSAVEVFGNLGLNVCCGIVLRG